jgi:hypothetical protein
MSSRKVNQPLGLSRFASFERLDAYCCLVSARPGQPGCRSRCSPPVSGPPPPLPPPPKPESRGPGARGELQGLDWLWLVPAGTHSHKSRSVERWPSCSITRSGRLASIGVGALAAAQLDRSPCPSCGSSGCKLSCRWRRPGSWAPGKSRPRAGGPDPAAPGARRWAPPGLGGRH